VAIATRSQQNRNSQTLLKRTHPHSNVRAFKTANPVGRHDETPVSQTKQLNQATAFHTDKTRKTEQRTFWMSSVVMEVPAYAAICCCMIPTHDELVTPLLLRSGSRVTLSVAPNWFTLCAHSASPSTETLARQCKVRKARVALQRWLRATTNCCSLQTAAERLFHGSAPRGRNRG
jgi:hypothetical protein